MTDRRKNNRPLRENEKPGPGSHAGGFRGVCLLACLALLAAALSLPTGCGRSLLIKSYDVEDLAPQPPESATEDAPDNQPPASETAQFPDGAETRPGNPEAWGPGAQMSVGRSFDPIYFENESSELDFSARRRLKTYAAWLNSHLNVWVTLAGYASREGTEEFAFNLSMARSLAVEDFLRGAGLSPTRLYTISYGDVAPQTQEETADETAPAEAPPSEVNELARCVEILAFIAPINVAEPEAVLVAPGDSPDSENQPEQEAPVEIP